MATTPAIVFAVCAMNDCLKGADPVVGVFGILCFVAAGLLLFVLAYRR